MFLIAVIYFLAIAVKIGVSNIFCEKIELFKGTKKCCFFNETTTVSETNITIGDFIDHDVSAVLFNDNKKILFLPINIYVNFPNLEFYFAENASVKEVSALNFKLMSNLKWLDLRLNQIEFIPNDCFEGLFKLIGLNLGTFFFWK